jgi:hypothetical protein
MKRNLVWALLSCVLLTSAGRASASERITVSGKVLLVGNVPFVEMIIHDSKGRDWFVSGDDRESLNALVGEEVTVEGVPQETELSLADGTKKFKRYSLSQIVILPKL